MNIVICDDIEQYCKEIDKIIWNMADEFEEHINVISFNSVQGLYKYLKNNKVDLIFLNLELKDGSGIDVSRTIRYIWGDEYTQIAYITGTSGYEKQLFQYHPIDYIEKPFEREKVEDCIRRTYKKIYKGKIYFVYSCDYEKRYINVDDILMFETIGKDIAIVTKTEKIIYRSSLNKVNKQLVQLNFARINQSTIVNLKYVKRYNGKEIELENGCRYIIGSRYKEVVKYKYL